MDGTFITGNTYETGVRTKCKAIDRRWIRTTTEFEEFLAETHRGKETYQSTLDIRKKRRKCKGSTLFRHLHIPVLKWLREAFRYRSVREQLVRWDALGWHVGCRKDRSRWHSDSIKETPFNGRILFRRTERCLGSTTSSHASCPWT